MKRVSAYFEFESLVLAAITVLTVMALSLFAHAVLNSSVFVTTLG